LARQHSVPCEAVAPDLVVADILTVNKDDYEFVRYTPRPPLGGSGDGDLRHCGLARGATAFTGAEIQGQNAFHHVTKQLRTTAGGASIQACECVDVAVCAAGRQPWRSTARVPDLCARSPLARSGRRDRRVSSAEGSEYHTVPREDVPKHHTLIAGMRCSGNTLTLLGDPWYDCSPPTEATICPCMHASEKPGLVSRV
jgi:hypothetical protein